MFFFFPFIYLARCSERTIDEFLESSNHQVGSVSKMTRIEVDDTTNNNDIEVSSSEYIIINPKTTILPQMYYNQIYHKTKQIRYNYLISPLNLKDEYSVPNVIYMGA